jgi:hypothetical protein
MAGVDLYTDGAAVTPNDGTDLPNKPANGLVAQVAGNVSVHFHGESTAVVIGIAAGQVLPIKVDRVLSTSTTATGIVALY